jgi:hypothetical protein
MNINILSWNVLLREHEIRHNPNSLILKHFPHETDRENAIITILKSYFLWALPDELVVTLQEVSLSLFQKILTEFPGKNVFGYCITPSSNNLKLDNCDGEYLVTIAPHDFQNSFCPQEPNTANGYLCIYNSHVTILNTHLIPQKYTHVNVMEYLKMLEVSIGMISNHGNTKHNEPFKSNIPLIIAGDFNETYHTVKSTIEDHFTVPYFGKTYKKVAALDHIVFNNKNKYNTKMNMYNLVSDHALIYINILPYRDRKYSK